MLIINNTVDRWAATAGLLAAPFYLMLIILLGTLEPGFSHRTSLMSTLGGVPGIRGLAFNISVAATGVFVITFAIGLQRQLPPRWTAKVGSALLVIGGLGFIGAGIHQIFQFILPVRDLTWVTASCLNRIPLFPGDDRGQKNFFAISSKSSATEPSPLASGIAVSILLVAEPSLPAAADCLLIMPMAAAATMGSICFRMPLSSPVAAAACPHRPGN
ncbi:MAG: DUF998 domain-containing protein [Pseudomonadota bacterium]